MIVKEGNSILTKPCEFLTVLNYREQVNTFLRKSIPHREGSVGIAANQVGMSAMIFSMKIGKTWKTFINPTIDKLYGDKITHVEACLSIPGVDYAIERNTKVDIGFYDYNFKKHNKTYESLKAIVIQHEVDHLNGYLISMKGIRYIG